MKKINAIIVALLLGMFSAAVAHAAKIESNPLLPDDLKALTGAVELVDRGDYVAALKVYESLDKKYPRNFLVQYEYMYLRYKMGDYARVVKVGKDLVKSPDADPMAYQLYGNALDMSGKTDKARKVYSEGLRRFPSAGSLWLELGNLENIAGNYTEALRLYNAGVQAQPSFPSNYYQAALLYLSSNQPVWGLVYAETAILLAPDNHGRNRNLAEAMAGCFRDNITVSFEPDNKSAVKITLCPGESMIVPAPGADGVYVTFPGIYETCMLRGITEMAFRGEVFLGTIPQLAALRRAAVEAYFPTGAEYFGNAMCLPEYQKKIIDAGHWEAYNYFLFYAIDQADAAAWLADNDGRFSAFLLWLQANPLRLDADHTVGFNNILAHCSLLDPEGAARILEKLATQPLQSGNQLTSAGATNAE